MALRVSSFDVESVISHLPKGVDVTPFIEAANQTVDRLLVSKGFTDEELKTIEKFLAAHFVCLDRPARSSDSGVGVSAAYHRPVAEDGLKATAPGRILAMLDRTGLLAQEALNTVPVEFEAINVHDGGVN